MNIGKLISARADHDGCLHVSWDDGQQARIDIGKIASSRPVLAALLDQSEFSQATLSHDGWSVEWPCGIDFGAAQLRLWARQDIEPQRAA